MSENRFNVGPVSFEAIGDRLIVEEDPFRSGYECRECEGRGYNICDECEGGKSRTNPNIRCKACNGSLKRQCESCHGKGGLIAVPETAQRRPTTGTVRSVGELVGFAIVGGARIKVDDPLKVGDKVMYGSFSGHLVDLETTERVVLRILSQSEILSRVTGNLEYRMGRGKSDLGPTRQDNEAALV